MNRRKFFGAAFGVSALSLPVAGLEQNTEQAYVNMVHCPSCSMTMFHTKDDGEPRIECSKPDCRLFGIRYKAPTVKLQPV
jgi:hypothetical protein